MFKDATVRAFDHCSFQVSIRVRRCLILTAALCSLLWLTNLNRAWTTPTQPWPWTDPVTDSSLMPPGHELPRSKIGKVTMAYGEPNAVYGRALASHERHAKQHGYRMFVLQEPLLHGVWSKLVYMMTLVANELQKPPAERLEWLFWHDADTYILNPNVPLETFLPPAKDPAYRNISFLAANDHHGLQAGTFLLRVDAWAIELMSAAIALPRYRPDMYLKLLEQTALEYLVDPKTDSTAVMGFADENDDAGYFPRRSVIVPQRWYNAYLGRRHWDGTPFEDRRVQPAKNATYGVQEGDLLIHSSGYVGSKFEGMTAFMDSVERCPEKWAQPFEQTDLREEAEAFWQRWKARELLLGTTA